MIGIVDFYFILYHVIIFFLVVIILKYLKIYITSRPDIMCNISLFSPFSLVYEMINKMTCDNQKSHIITFRTLFLLQTPAAQPRMIIHKTNKKLIFC